MTEAHNDRSAGSEHEPVLKKLRFTRDVMKRARMDGKNYLMSIWEQDVEGVEEAIKILSSDGGVESGHATASGSGPLPEPTPNGDACSALEPPHQAAETVGRQQELKRAAGVTTGPSDHNTLAARDKLLKILRQYGGEPYSLVAIDAAWNAAIDTFAPAQPATGPTNEQIEAIAKDYAQRWYGDDFPLMEDDDKAELRIEAHRWLKCWFAVAEQPPAATVDDCRHEDYCLHPSCDCSAPPSSSAVRETVIGADGKSRPITLRQIVARAALSVIEKPDGVETLDWQIADAVLTVLPAIEPQQVSVLGLTERIDDVILMLDAPDAYNREYIAAVCRSIRSQLSRPQLGSGK